MGSFFPGDFAPDRISHMSEVQNLKVEIAGIMLFLPLDRPYLIEKYDIHTIELPINPNRHSTSDRNGNARSHPTNDNQNLAIAPYLFRYYNLWEISPPDFSPDVTDCIERIGKVCAPC